MEKVRSRKEVAAQLKAKEQEINGRIEALQKEVLHTGEDIKEFVKKNTWVSVAGSVVAGILVGLVLGKKNRKTQHRELVDQYMNRLADVARKAGAGDREVGELLRDALRDTMPPVIYSQPQKRSRGLGHMLMNMGADMAIGFAKKSLFNILDDRAKPGADSDLPERVDSEF